MPTDLRPDPAMLGTSGHERRARDFYPTPEDATDASIDWLDMIAFGANMKIWECAAGDLAMTTPLIAAGHSVVSSDLMPLAEGIHTFDFLSEAPFPDFARGCNGIVTNPPYGELAQKFVEKALQHLQNGNVNFVVMLMRHEYDCAVGRRHLFDDCPYYAAKITLTFRPRWIADSSGSPRHNYAWYVWTRHNSGRARQFYAHRKIETVSASEALNGIMGAVS